MDYIRHCHVYDGTKCNCPEGTCRRQQADDDAKLYEQRAQEEESRLIDLLIDFQIYLKDAGYINDHDWTWEDEATTFLRQR